MDKCPCNLHNSCMEINKIQNFNLFGEAINLPDVVHCESIYARSSLHNWELSPHRHTRLHQVLLVQQGGGRAYLDGHSHALAPALVVNVPVGTVHAFTFHPETQGYVVTLGQEILAECLKDSEGIRHVVSRPEIFKTTNEISEIIANIADEHAHLTFGRAHILRAMSAQLIGEVARAISQLGAMAKSTAESPLSQAFEALLDTHFTEQWGVTDYASALNVTAGHLTRTLRGATGLPASRIIDARIVREARRYIAYTNLSISEIGYALGFNDPAYFSRVFTRSTGVSPRKFRLDLEKTAE